MIEKFYVSTPQKGMVDVTTAVKEAAAASSVKNGLCHIFVPHTTAGITINENADPDVVKDILAGLEAMVPHLPYRHSEGNSRAHIQASLLGSSVSIPIENHRLLLGTWQGIYLAEFDGPRRRAVCVNCGGEL